MIRSLIIGNEVDVGHYSTIIDQSKYFGKQEKMIVAENHLQEIKFSEHNFDALFLVSSADNPYQLFEQAIKTKTNFYFVHQPLLNRNELISLDKLYLESNNLLFPEVIELEHPIVQEFITTTGSYLMFRYNKSIASKKLIRATIFSALCFLSILSPMQVKKIDINSIETSNDGKPVFKVRLKMYDSSLAYIILKLSSDEDHNIMIESQNGSFLFSINQNYLENIHGVRFNSTPISTTELLKKTIEAFGLHIILNTNCKFNFHHYVLSTKPLEKILSILQDSF